MKKLAIITLFLLTLIPLTAIADSSVGCGLGTLVWKKNTIVSALFRLTTNQTFSSQLFGITTGTSGCTQHSIVMKTKEPIYYAQAHLDELKIDIARGEGPYLEGLTASLDCSKEGGKKINQLAKNHYDILSKSANVSATQFLGDFIQMTKENDQTSNSCANLTIYTQPV